MPPSKTLFLALYSKAFSVLENDVSYEMMKYIIGITSEGRTSILQISEALGYFGNKV